MADWIFILIDLFFIVAFLFNLFWQAQIVVPAKYKISSLVLTVFLAIWILSLPSDSWWYVLMVAAFLTTTLMQGTGGLGKKRLITNSFFAGVLGYQKVEHVTLVPIELPDTPAQVVAIFTTINRQNIQMTFKKSITDFQKDLQDVLPNNIKIDISRL
ncbi:hypothetical protein MOO45_00485 [Bombilactobacillus folatiphilus]|uniref:Uncharacterized protein n=1 Tax=Bombilactobacillus folatiphilus TaxID=2923362 RepID=A0ABY4P9J4_9LACO|nr:hypothetical protein [Bombilactobacillus folatiphilus]UQS82206.1 hypothetical protein MOO45_00485 [Bombilactobacillus folatiphilus]